MRVNLHKVPGKFFHQLENLDWFTVKGVPQPYMKISSCEAVEFGQHEQRIMDFKDDVKVQVADVALDIQFC